MSRTEINRICFLFVENVNFLQLFLLINIWLIFFSLMCYIFKVTTGMMRQFLFLYLLYLSLLITMLQGG